MNRSSSIMVNLLSRLVERPGEKEIIVPLLAILAAKWPQHQKWENEPARISGSILTRRSGRKTFPCVAIDDCPGNTIVRQLRNHLFAGHVKGYNGLRSRYPEARWVRLWEKADDGRS